MSSSSSFSYRGGEVVGRVVGNPHCLLSLPFEWWWVSGEVVRRVVACPHCPPCRPFRFKATAVVKRWQASGPWSFDDTMGNAEVSAGKSTGCGG